MVLKNQRVIDRACEALGFDFTVSGTQVNLKKYKKGILRDIDPDLEESQNFGAFFLETPEGQEDHQKDELLHELN